MPALFFAETLPARCSNAIVSLHFTNRVSAALVELSTGDILYESGWADAKDIPLPAGSLMKLYALLAKTRLKPADPAETHPCRGNGPGIPYTEECWLREGHGNPDLMTALAYSCNTWFYHYAQDLDFSLYLDTLRMYGAWSGSENFGRANPERREQIQAMTGKMNVLRVRPSALLESLRRVFAGKSAAPESLVVLMGDALHEAYANGTASRSRKALGMKESLPIFCKTGTGAVEEEGSVSMKRSNGLFFGVWEGRFAVLAVAEDSTGAGNASLAGLSLLRAAAAK